MSEEQKTKESDLADFVFKNLAGDQNASYYASDLGYIMEPGDNGQWGARACTWNALTRFFIQHYIKLEKRAFALDSCKKALNNPVYINEAFSWKYSPQGSYFWRDYYEGTKEIDEDYRTELSTLIEMLESEMQEE